MIKQTAYASILIVAAIFFLSGCGNTFGVKKVAYVKPIIPGENEVQIYVFREDSSFGGARKFSIINNDTIVGVLTPGTFTHYTVSDGENEVVFYISPSPLNHLRISNRPGETVYLFCHMGYTTGIFIEEIDKKKAQELMQSFEYTEIEIKGARAKMNYKNYYDNLYN